MPGTTHRFCNSNCVIKTSLNTLINLFFNFDAVRLSTLLLCNLDLKILNQGDLIQRVNLRLIKIYMQFHRWGLTFFLLDFTIIWNSLRIKLICTVKICCHHFFHDWYQWFIIWISIIIRMHILKVGRGVIWIPKRFIVINLDSLIVGRRIVCLTFNNDWAQ